ncbi:5-hydroxytryptamine receptor 2A-like [Exaiptasia diaphana]|uniref:G-protein coupled receptors family 1 profile domain-containing protein n=1 Tax=Exaiptasia diaphana TaxID=2652724 RepID=A0A913WPI0_EXADI|nr:5-hydroxytryptamine receptor 2A-like [Exaiptasia diaphana]
MDNIWPEIFMVESAAIVVGNLLTIAVLSNKRFLKKRGNWLIINLAVADLLVGALSEPLYIATIKGTTKNISTVYTSCDILLGMASVFGLAVLALDRLFAISWPFRHRTVSNRPYICSIVGIWLTAAIVAVISLIVQSRRSVFFYVLLPLLTLSQIIMIFSYVAIWVIVTTKRPAKSIKRRRCNSIISSERSSDNEGGSVRHICVGFRYDSDDCHLDEETGSVTILHGFHRDSVEDLPPARIHLVAINNKKLQVGKVTDSLINGSTNTTESTSHFKKSFQTFGKSFTEQKEQKMSFKRLRRMRLKVKQRRESIDRDNRLALTLFMVTAISLLAWLPFEIMNIIFSLCKSCRVKLYNIHVLSLTKLLHYANSVVNPIIYTFRITEFRRTVNAILTLKFLKKKQPRLRSGTTEHNGTTVGYSFRVKSAIRTAESADL